MTTTATHPDGTRVGADPRTVLQSVWIFAVLSYLYCDVLTLMRAEDLNAFLAGEVGGMQISDGFLLAAALLMQVPIAMILVSRLAPYRIARAACLAAGCLMTVVQAASLLVGTGPTAFYLVYSAIEIAATLFVVGFAWRWRETA